MAFELEGLRDILVCPKSKSRLVLHKDSLISTDPECRLSYPIKDGIPIMLVEEATELSHEEWAALMLEQPQHPADQPGDV